MCVVSMVGDTFNDRWKDQFPQFIPGDINPHPDTRRAFTYEPSITRAEFEALRREVELMKALLTRAKLYDEKNNEPDCEVEEKVALLKRVAEMVGVSLDDVLGK